jgi:hypothetical protein
MTGRLARSPERWAAISVKAVMEGSAAQVEYALLDAVHDIRIMADAIYSITVVSPTMDSHADAIRLAQRALKEKRS